METAHRHKLEVDRARERCDGRTVAVELPPNVPEPAPVPHEPPGPVIVPEPAPVPHEPPGPVIVPEPQPQPPDPAS
jgi:hypothetical protein